MSQDLVNGNVPESRAADSLYSRIVADSDFGEQKKGRHKNYAHKEELQVLVNYVRKLWAYSSSDFSDRAATRAEKEKISEVKGNLEKAIEDVCNAGAFDLDTIINSNRQYDGCAGRSPNSSKFLYDQTPTYIIGSFMHYVSQVKDAFAERIGKGRLAVQLLKIRDYFAGKIASIKGKDYLSPESKLRTQMDDARFWADFVEQAIIKEQPYEKCLLPQPVATGLSAEEINRIHLKAKKEADKLRDHNERMRGLRQAEQLQRPSERHRKRVVFRD